MAWLERYGKHQRRKEATAHCRSNNVRETMKEELNATEAGQSWADNPAGQEATDATVLEGEQDAT